MSVLRVLTLLIPLFFGCSCTCLSPPASPTSARIAFGSCAMQGAHQPVWEGIVSTRPDLLILAGDNIYADTEDMELMRAMYAELGKQPGFQSLKATGPIYATWDDHDYGLNDGGSEFVMKDEAKGCFMEFFEIPGDHPMRERQGIYHEQRLILAGLDVQVILLDTRTFRGPLQQHSTTYPDRGPYTGNPDPSIPLLGEAQWSWLEHVLRQPADLRILVSSIQLVPEDHHWERWANLPAERERLFALLRDTQANGVIVISGDRHHGELSAIDVDLGYPLYDLTASGLNQAWKRPKDEANRHRIGDMYLDDHFGVIDIERSGAGTIIRLELRDIEGTPVLSHEIPLEP